MKQKKQKKQKMQIVPQIMHLTILFLIMIASGLNLNQNPSGIPDEPHPTYFSPQSAGQPTQDINNLSQIEAFFDAFIPQQLSAYNISGMTISLVHNDTMSFAKGYGYSDVKNNKLVEANSTLFRIGSISKMFTWTALMQLYEQGKVDLHADINNYLTSFQIPNTFAEPITLTHLMTHTAGFEETLARVIGEDDVFPELSDMLRENLPPRHFKPGTVPSYSNYGTALAGLIVEDVTNTSFNQYIEENIFQPLNMTRSSFRQPLPAHLAESMSEGYFSSAHDGGFFEYVSVEPAGSMSSTSVDIAKFMIAQLNNGTYLGNRLLQPETVALMQTPQFTPHEGFPSIRYGFYDLNLFDQKSFGHGGDTLFFHSQMSLFPEKNFGMFVSYNSMSSLEQPIVLQANFIKQFMYTRSFSTLITPIEDYEDLVGRFVGSYESTRVAYSTPDKLYYAVHISNFFNQLETRIMEISANDQGQLEAFGMLFLEIEANVFQDIHGKGIKLYFHEDDESGKTYLYVNGASISAFEKMSWYDSYSFQMWLVIMIPVIFGLSILCWSIEGIVKFTRKKKQKEPLPKKPTTPDDIQISNVFQEKPKAKWVINWPRIIVLGQVLLSVIFVILVYLFHGFRFDYTLPYDEYFNQILIIPYFILALVAATFLNSLFEWGGKNFQRTADQPLKTWEKIHFSLVVFTGIAWVWIINYWNLLGISSGGVV